MADSPRKPDPGDDTHMEVDRGATPGTSRWQKVVGIIGLLVILWVGNRMLGTLLGHGHGAMRHGPRQDAPPAEIQEQEIDTDTGGVHAPPPGFH
jgi:hypothetical protein